METENKLQLVAAKEVEYYRELYMLVDFLNKSLKDRNLIFGLSLKGQDKMIVSIYET